MITVEILGRFLEGVRGQALREGTRYARENRVHELVGTPESVTTVVDGRTGDYEVALWVEGGEVQHRCECPSWRVPCKHEVAAALVLRQSLVSEDAGGRKSSREAAEREGPEEARAKAVEERVTAADREELAVRPDEAPYLRVESASGFSYRVHLRGGPGGPHSCDCPDFEANRLHTCKHVERVRRYLRAPRRRELPGGHVEGAERARIYLFFGEVVEPRLHGRPRGRGARELSMQFDERGVPIGPVSRDERDLLRWLDGFGGRVEKEALAWLARRVERRPELPERKIAALVGRLAHEPYPYQWTGAEFLARTGRALLADEMGLGKTVQAIVAALALRRARRPARSVTVVCPASLRGGWRDEIARWTGEEAVFLEGNAKERAGTIEGKPPWLLTHYEQVLRDHRLHREHPPDLLVLDEAQRAKGLWARTARVLKAIDARYVFALTGTPLENRLEDAYAIAQLIDQRLLPPLWQVDRDHFVREDGGRRVVMYRNLDALRSRLAPAFLRRRKEDVAIELPERIRSVSSFPMHEAVVDTYEDVMAQVRRIAARKHIPPAELERMQRLLVIARRCCNGPHMLGKDVDDRHVPKLAELEDVLRELCLGERRKAVVFSEWTDMTERVEALSRRLGLPTFHLRGSVPVKLRPAMIRSFGTEKGPAVFVSTDAGGLGLNLQAADVVVNLDQPWNPARLEQRVARVHRIGSKRATREILFVTKDSVEERILHLHETKKNVLENVWAKGGEDVIAAPGGSGAFREVVAALLAAPRSREDAGGVSATAGADARAGAAAAPGVGKGGNGSGGVPRAGRGELSGGNAPESKEPPVAVDLTAIAAAVSAALPAIPAEQRRPLAAVFHALADVLESAG